MVLEISATPSIFTFKLWDWGRLGLDGLPRPINIGHGSKVIQWERQTEFTRDNLVNRVTPIASGEGWREERTGLHENEFIETRRHWFTAPVTHHTDGGVQVFNLIEGDEVIIESPTGVRGALCGDLHYPGRRGRIYDPSLWSFGRKGMWYDPGFRPVQAITLGNYCYGNRK